MVVEISALKNNLRWWVAVLMPQTNVAELTWVEVRPEWEWKF